MKKLLLTLTGVSTMMTALFAQASVDLSVCYGKGYTLSSTAAAPPFGATSYSWYENSDLLADKNEVSLSIPAGKPLGDYAYVRVAANEACPDGIASNTVTVMVNPVPAIHTASQTVNQGTPISTIIYTASNGAVISMTGSLPPGVTGTPSGASFTISGTPSATGTFGYALVSTLDACTSTATAVTITVVCGGDISTPAGAASTQMWCFGTQTWSDRIAATQSSCASAATLSTANPLPAQYKIYNDNGVDHYYYNWTCVNAAQNTLCPWPWRVPSQSDFNALYSFVSGLGSVLFNAWGYGGYATGSSMNDVSSSAYYWSSTEFSGDTNRAYLLYYTSGDLTVNDATKSNARQVRCVR
jgi:hypothetical protein